MKKLLSLNFVFSALFLLLGFTMSAQQTFKVDPMHSSMNFNIKHNNISFVPGKFDKFEGTLVFSKADFSDAKINFSADVSSVNTGVEMRDNHLKSKDFFEVEKFPTMRFVSTSFTKAKGGTYLLKGNLTIKDVSRPVVFNVTYGGKATKDSKTIHGFQARTTINRFDYNVNYDPTAAGIAKNVDIVVFLEMVPK